MGLSSVPWLSWTEWENVFNNVCDTKGSIQEIQQRRLAAIKQVSVELYHINNE
jgi:hypothetical protein